MVELYQVRAADEPISQGDILKSVLCIDATTGADGVIRSAMVISYGCEMDKPVAADCYVAEVRLLRNLPANLHAPIRDGKVYAVIYLPDTSSLAGDSYVDLRCIYRVPFAKICNPELRMEPNGQKVRVLSDSANRVASLSENGLAVLHGQLILFFTRKKPT